MKRILLVIVVGALLDQTEGRIKDLVSHPERRERSHRPDDAADMLIILPEEGRFEQVEERLNAGFLDGVSDELNLKYVRLTMARFDFETDLKLEKLLKIMGMEKPFSDADFSGMTGDRSLAFGDALHRANLTVDEKGTEAAAATVLDMPVSPKPEPANMTLDRPFVFAIVERETGTVLFLGRVANPEE
jgi:serpin B